MATGNAVIKLQSISYYLLTLLLTLTLSLTLFLTTALTMLRHPQIRTSADPLLPVNVIVSVDLH